MPRTMDAVIPHASTTATGGVADILRTGGEIVLEVLLRHKVEVVFGMPGGANLPLYDVLARKGGIRHYLCRHEQGAAHMAQGYARATGRIGVVLVTSGPAATNTVTALVDAKMDSTPVLVISGQVARANIGKDGFQEADVVGITLPATKHNEIVLNASEIERALEDAFRIATTGRPGPVLVDIPKDVQTEKAAYPAHAASRAKAGRAQGVRGDVEDAVRAFCEARRPVIYAGGGVITAGAHAELRELADITHAPVALTLMGLGAFPGSDPRFLGMLGMHGLYAANMSLYESDCIFAVGVRFDDRVTGKLAEFAPHARIIHLDIDAAEIGKNRKADWGIVADARDGLQAFNREARQYLSEGRTGRAVALEEWWKVLDGWKKDQPLSFKPKPGKILPQQVLQELQKQTAGDLVAVTDIGQHQMWAAQYLVVDGPRRFICSGGLGTMGYGMPAALGAQIAVPGKRVVAIVGDGGFQMTFQEMGLLMDQSIPLKILVINNGYLGMVRQWQELFYEKRYLGVDLAQSPDFVLLAQAYGIRSSRVSDPAGLAEAIREMLAHPGPYLLDARVDHAEHVFPMVPAGAASRDMILQPRSRSDDVNHVFRVGREQVLGPRAHRADVLAPHVQHPVAQRGAHAR